MINSLNSLKHSENSAVSQWWMEALTRSTMSPPKALNSKTTSDQVETSNRKHTRWHVRLSLHSTHSGSIRMFTTTTRSRQHLRKCFQLKKWISTVYSVGVLSSTRQTVKQETNSNQDIMWTEPNMLQCVFLTKKIEVRQITVWLYYGRRDWCLIQACCRPQYLSLTCQSDNGKHGFEGSVFESNHSHTFPSDRSSQRTC